MAQEILNNLLSSKIPPKEILNWLTTDNLNENAWLELSKICPKEEFIVFFLNNLRDQFKSVLQPPQTKQKRPISNDISSDPYNLNVTPVKSNVIGSESASINSNLSNIVSSSPNNSQSTPVKKVTKLPDKKRVELLSCNSSQGQNINPAFKESIEYDQVGNLTEDKSININNSSFPSLNESRFTKLNVSNKSTNANRSDCSDSSYTNVSHRSNLSMSNKILQSPVSPLYSHSVTTLSPINVKTPKSLFNKSSYLERSSTPEKKLHNNSKTPKTPRQSFDLSDFIVMDTRTSKKRSGKKGNIKVLQNNPDDQCVLSQNNSDDQCVLSQNNTDDQSVLLNTLTPSALNGRRKVNPRSSELNTKNRKVNPTRLQVMDEKGNTENTIFGTVSRPFTQNPQFVNVSPIDKSVDNESFQVERGLVKTERMKKPENATNANIVSNTNSEPSVVSEPQQYSILSNSSKKGQPCSIVIPNKELIENENILHILAELYSGFLDYNLIVNPMVELYYIIQLITIQYTSPIHQDVSNNQVKKIHNESVNAKTHLSALKKSLNFDGFGEEDNETPNDDENNSECKKSCNEPKCLNLVDAKENLNKINKKLENLSVTLSNDDVTNTVMNSNVENIDATENCLKPYLCSPHNCVYFSTLVLIHQKALLTCLDRVTLKLLYENHQIATFQPELCKYLNTIYSCKVAESNKIKPSHNIGTLDLNVCFQIETDNREKFPTMNAFQCFRKQRDMFYDILKIWEDKHLVPGWTFQIALSGKIKSMFAIHTDIANYTHFLRLFKSQMLISCIESGHQENLLDDEMANVLKDFQDVNPTKLTQLQKKFVTPLSQKGPVPLPSFPGKQEFYKDFILYASNSMFYTYLENTFISEIMDLNNSQFAGSDIEESETQVDETTKQNFIVCLSSLRLLSKFLGFVTSLPYRSETSMLEDVIASQVALRSAVLPRIDLHYCLQSAIFEGKLSLTVPWIVEYLSMLDHASLRLPYYNKILEMLYCIYRASNYRAITDPEEFMSKRAVLLLRLSIGWLFELPTFPLQSYYFWQSKYDDKALKKNWEIQKVITNIESNSNDTETSVLSVKHSLFLDKLEMIDDRTLYSCCPYLRELNILLTSGNSNVSSTASYRHVTPVTSQLQKPTAKTNVKHLEIQLEEAFFHGQPMSTRKTVEYISERIASTSVKYICNNLLPVERESIFQELECIINMKYSHMNKKSEEMKTVLLSDMNILAIKASNNIKEKSEQIIPKLCESRIVQSIDSLLAEDCLKAVKDMCVKIALRMTIDRIDQWIQSHIVGGSNFIKDMTVELSKSCQTEPEIDTDATRCRSNAICLSQVIHDTRILMWELQERSISETLAEESIADYWDRLYFSLAVPLDLQSTSEEAISTLSVELCLFLICYRDDLLTMKIIEKMLKVWKIDRLQFSKPNSPLSKLLCPRNVMLFSQVANKKIWITLGKFFKILLKENLLSIDSLNKQAVALFKEEWPIEASKNVSICLKEAINGYKSSDDETERMRSLLEWVAGAHSDMDRDSFDFF